MKTFNVPKWVHEELAREDESEWPSVVSHWAPRHLEIARIAHIFKEVAEQKNIPLKVVEPGTGSGLTAYLLALEGISVHAFEKDSYRLPICKRFLPFFERRKKRFGLKNSLKYSCDHIENILRYKDNRMLFASWPGPSTLDIPQYYNSDIVYDFRPAWARLRPEAIIFTEQVKCVHTLTPVCMSVKPYNYMYLTSWLSQNHGHIKGNLRDKDELTTVEAYTREKLDIKMPEGIDEVEPYPWENRLYPASGRMRYAKELYKFRDRPLSR